MMQIRPATVQDIPEIIAFTRETFSWGDYVPDAIASWIDDPEGMVMVAELEGRPVGVARATLLTPTEAWAHGARVHPDHRGKRIANRLADVLIDWARGQGAQVVRLLVEDDNEPSIRHVERVGFRRTVRVLRATRTVGEATANPQGNGVRHGPSSLTAKPGKAQDAPLVMSAWASSDIGRAMRGLAGFGWRFHRLRSSDVEAAARTSNLWEIGSSWAMTGTVEPWFQVGVVETRADDAYETFRAITDAANTRGALDISIWIPNLAWLVQPARRAGYDTEPSSIWEHPL